MTITPYYILPSLYVLELESDYETAKRLGEPTEGMSKSYNIYCGVTMDLSKRLSQHFNNQGSHWTKFHKPIKVRMILIGDHINEKYENEITLKIMKKMESCGSTWSRVRGGSWTSINCKKPSKL